MELFNKEDIYDNEISPLMQQIIEICNKHKMPMIASVTYENNEELGPGRCTTLLNGFEDRADDANQKAAKVIKNGGHETFTMAISKSA